MLLSGILTVKRAPLILLYKVLFDRNNKGETDVLNVNSIRFAHYVGSLFSLAAILFLYVFKINLIGYILIGILTLLQTMAAFGYCSAQKLYECLILGKNCCNLGKKLRGGHCNVR
jgi:Na+/pantothenate symporter